MSLENPLYNNFPNSMAPAEEKAGENYGMSYAKAIWSNYLQRISNYTEQRQRWILNRKYAEGLQSVQKYKDRMDLGDTSWMNLDFTPIAIIPKFVNNITSVLTGNRYKVNCEVLNNVSKVSQDEYRNKLNANRLMKPLHDELAPKTGVPMMPAGAFVAEDNEELDIYMQQNFKPSEAMAMQLALKYVFGENNFPDIEKQCVRDLVVNDICSVRRYYDSHKNICLEYIDPVDLVYPYSKYDDFRNIPWAGVVKKYTIQDLSVIAPSLSEEDLFDIAKQYTGSNYGNRNWGWGTSYAGYYQSNGILSGRAYDDFYINVLEFEFLAVDSLKYEKKTSKERGATYVNRKNSSYEPKSDSNYKKEIIDKTIKNRYEGSWIIGSKYLYGYGKANNIPREKINGTYSTDATLQTKIIAPNIYDMQNKSLVERMIPSADSMTLIKLKIQQLLMKIVPPGVGIDADAVENVMLGLGGKAMDAREVIRMFTQTGSLVFRSKRADGSLINGKPIEILPNGIPPGFETLMSMWNAEIQQIYSVIGYNPAAAGEASSESLVGVGQQQLSATSNSLRPLSDAFVKIATKVAKETALMIQDKIEYGEGLEGFERSIGKEGVEIIKAMKGLPQCEFGITVEYMPDNAELAEATNKINIALQAQLIDLDDAIQVEQQLKSDVKLAVQLLVYLKKKRQKSRMEEAKANSDNNSQQQQDSAQAAAQAQQQALTLEASIKEQLLKTEYDLKARNAALEHKNKMEELLLVNDGKLNMQKLAHDSQLLHTAFEIASTPPEPTVPTASA